MKDVINKSFIIILLLNISAFTLKGQEQKNEKILLIKLPFLNLIDRIRTPHSMKFLFNIDAEMQLIKNKSVYISAGYMPVIARGHNFMTEYEYRSNISVTKGDAFNFVVGGRFYLLKNKKNDLTGFYLGPHIENVISRNTLKDDEKLNTYFFMPAIHFGYQLRIKQFNIDIPFIFGKFYNTDLKQVTGFYYRTPNISLGLKFNL